MTLSAAKFGESKRKEHKGRMQMDNAHVLRATLVASRVASLISPPRCQLRRVARGAAGQRAGLAGLAKGQQWADVAAEESTAFNLVKRWSRGPWSSGEVVSASEGPARDLLSTLAWRWAWVSFGV